MKTQKYKSCRFLLLLIPFFFLTISCEESDSSADKTEIPDQLFRPVAFTTNINGNIVSFSWVPISNASYSLEISRDSLLFVNDLQIFPIDGVSDYSIGDLWSNSRYSARIKAISKDGSVKDSEYKQTTFVTGIENIFYDISPENIFADHILLEWDNSKNVSTIVISADGSADTTVELSGSDIEQGKKIIENLKNKTNYTFKIFLGEMLRGTVSTKTL
ncbi:MAG: hypothetical protein PHI28_04805 [Mangrovibacterium sp.]|nr:hypothetical protein [Mangrovibacterium sp.]